jgi:hypothetical protein
MAFFGLEKDGKIWLQHLSGRGVTEVGGTSRTCSTMSTVPELLLVPRDLPKVPTPTYRKSRNQSPSRYDKTQRQKKVQTEPRSSVHEMMK